MSLFDTGAAPRRSSRTVVLISELDAILTAQLVVAWAGEGGEEPRLGWWRSDLVSEFGGEDLFRRLLPTTWHWATLQGAREAARRRDAELRRQDHDPDRILSLFHFGFELDERIEERFQTWKRSSEDPYAALPGLHVIAQGWDRAAFLDWVQGHGEAEVTPTPVGRLVKGLPPQSLERRVRGLVAALAPTEGSYPLPHVRSAP
jgi:hypothetical protein